MKTLAKPILHASAVALFLLAIAPPALAWNPAPCGAATAAARAAFRARVRVAKPGQPLYVVHPTPAAEQNVVIDLISQFPGGQSADFAAVARGIASGNFPLDVKQVEDWTPDRCSAGGDRGDGYFLVTVRDTHNAEVARGAILDSGLLASVGLLKEAPRDVGPVPPLNEAVARLAARGIHVRDPQYVAASGTINCRMLDPCIAMRNANGIYLVRGNQIALLPIGAPIFAAPPKAPYVSIGTGAFVTAVPLR